jgi:rhamnogalacturonan endolyase
MQGIRLRVALLSGTLSLLWVAWSATADAPTRRPPENLSRGLVALRVSDSEVLLTWRLLQTDPADVAFQVYRHTDLGEAVRVNAEPQTNATFLIDREADLQRETHYVVRAVINGVETDENPVAYVPAGASPRQYLSIPLEPPAGGVTPDGVAYTYAANDASAADLDGDGDYEIILKWDPTNSKDNSLSGHTGNVFLDAYRMDGSRLWRMDLGRNIRAGAHYTQFLSYDLDGDGRAEVALKTAPGTLDAAGEPIGMRAERFAGAMPESAFDPQADYRNSAGYVLTGPEFFTVFDGLTGRELMTAYYHPPRNSNVNSGDVTAWGDNYGNRVDRFLGAVAYLDGERPSLVWSRGYYTRTVLDAWNWRDGKLSRVWTFDTRDAANPQYRAYEAQGNHSLSVGDVDGDGRDEILFGAAAIDDNGSGLYNTGWGHGDALHAGDLLPSRPGLEVFQPHETPSQYRFNALDLRDARTGELICGVEATGDIGRGAAADIDPRYPGAEFWGSGTTGGLYSASSCEPNAEKGPRGKAISTRKPGQINFAIWWDGDWLRELLDGTSIFKWDWAAEQSRNIFAPAGLASNNGTKATPVLTADLFGDWREEVIWRTTDNSELRIYTTVIPTAYRSVTLMQDRQYRLAVAWQNVGYNQPPHPSFAMPVAGPD